MLLSSDNLDFLHSNCDEKDVALNNTTLLRLKSSPYVDFGNFFYCLDFFPSNKVFQLEVPS